MKHCNADRIATSPGSGMPHSLGNYRMHLVAVELAEDWLDQESVAGFGWSSVHWRQP